MAFAQLTGRESLRDTWCAVSTDVLIAIVKKEL